MHNFIQAFKKGINLQPLDMEPLIIGFLEEDNDPYAEKLKTSYMNGVKLNISPILFLYNHGDPAKIQERMSKISEFNSEQQKRFNISMYRVRLCAFMRGANTVFNRKAIHKHYSWCMCNEWSRSFEDILNKRSETV